MQGKILFISSLRRAVSFGVAMVLLAVARGQTAYFTPERLLVIDITPNNLSGESIQNDEPSLGVGTSANYGKFVVHAINTTLFSTLAPTNYLYTTTGAGSFGLPWVGPSSEVDLGASLDWSSGGTCYAAFSLLSSPFSIGVSSSPDPTAGVPFSPIAGATFVPDRPLEGPGAVKPCLKVVNVSSVDHIFVGFNDNSRFPGPTASVHYSLNGGTTWNTTLIEQATPAAGFDSPAVRLAVSADGQTVYGLFQRVSAWSTDFTGDVVLVRDDGSGASGYSALGTGTLVAQNIVIPWGSTLGAQQLYAGQCDVAIDPARPSEVYVAYTEMDGTEPTIRVQSSTDGGASFNLAWTVANASLPALAVASDGTVGMLYLQKNGGNLEVHFLKAFFGDFSIINDRVLAQFPNGNPSPVPLNSYLGNSFTLKAVNFNFFGTFSASGNPDPADFPSGPPFYQRNVKVGATVMNNFTLTSPGTLVDQSGRNTVSPSIDPFFFYDFSSSLRFYNVRLRPVPYHDPSDPLNGVEHLVWPELGTHEPQFQLFSSSSLGANAAWNAAGGNAFEANGQFESALYSSQPQAFFRLEQNVGGGQFEVFSAGGQNGFLYPTGIVAVPGTSSFTFVANPSNNFAVAHWYLDGAPVQAGGSTLTLSNINSEHSVVATFVGSNDLAVTLANVPIVPGPTVTLGTNVYEINIQNDGLNPLSSITMADQLPPTVAFVSATASQGTVSYSGGTVTGSIGALAPGASASVNITFVPLATGSITDNVSVACSAFEPDLSNNSATNESTVIDPIIITNQPASQTVPPGGTATFSVGVSGTPPFFYQWVFNSNSVAGATGSSLTVSNVTAAQAGLYSVAVFQAAGLLEGVLKTNSAAASLSIGPSPPASGLVQIIQSKKEEGK